LGNDALALGRQSYQQNLEELERWASVSQSTDFDGLETSTFDHKVAELLANPRA